MKLLLATTLLFVAAVPALIAASFTPRLSPVPPQTTSPRAPNSDPVYLQLRNITAGGKAITVKDFVMKRDAGTFTFQSGNFFFLTPVEGKTTGAVFIGSATFSLNPPLEAERRSLKLLTKSNEMLEHFKSAIFRFTDGTEEEIEAKGSVPAQPVAGPASEMLADLRNTLRKNIQYNLDARILEDVLNSQPGYFFCAFIKGEKYSGKEVYVMDPHGIPGDFIGMDVAPEEVAFYTYDDRKNGTWASFHYSDEYKEGTASGRQVNAPYRVIGQKVDVTVEKSGHLKGTATTTILPFANGLRVIPLQLYPTLRVEAATDESHQPLAFIQEKKDEDYQYFLIAPKPLTAGKLFTFTTQYAGPDAVVNLGWGIFYPVVRSDWYPAPYSSGDFAKYELTFRIPKGMTMLATGSKTAERTEGNYEVSEWKTEVPIPNAGFNFGEFKKNEIDLPDQGIKLENYANVVMNYNTSNKMKRTLGEGQLAIPLYTDYFGPIPYKRLALTEQPTFYGQSFANLIFLPVLSYVDSSRMNFLGSDASAFFRGVGPHEIAHQWWGNTVGWESYRDQWMSEGFAEFSASLFLQTFFKDGTYDKFWDVQRKLLVEKDREGYRAIDVGPVTLGYRLGTSRAGFQVPLRLIYPKGAYILNMIRMMMWDNERQDADFKKLMHDFVHSYSGRPATTEDFKRAVELHMTPSMNLTADGKMDWFFNEYVYGTALPNEKFGYTFSNAPDGSVALNFKVEQSGVDPSFRMTIPVYIELAEGGAFRVGNVPLTGNTSFETQTVLRGLKTRPKRAMINYFHDVLCTQN
ncbi:MAG: M1 family aminopeptidase [Candidatus Acidiferrales bacterium]